MAMIHIDYNDTIKKAKRMEELAGEIDKIADNRVSNIYRALPASGRWTGSGAVMYQKKTKKYYDNLKRRAKNLRFSAQTLRGIAEKYKFIDEITPW